MRNKRLFWILALAFVIVGVLIGWVLWANTAPQTTQYTITSKDLPDSFTGFRIAQVSDLHNTAFGDNNYKLLDILRQEDISIIVITGDLADSDNLSVAIDFARQAAQIAPTYYVTGNHEAYISNYTQLEKDLTACGVTVLHNETVLLQRDGESIALSGIDDPQFGAVPSGVSQTEITANRLDQLRDNGCEYRILLAHRPEKVETYAFYNYDLVLCGHAHGGQFRLPFIGGLYAPNQGWLPQYDCGLYTVSGTQMVVSRGLGNSGFPLRFNNRPEIVIIQLNSL